MRYAVIGTSWIAEAYIKAANLAGGADLAAVYSRDAQRGGAFADKTGAQRVITSLDELAEARDIDAVYIATPNSLHFEQSRLMLENGKHVICEKPAATYPEEIRQLINLARRSSLVYMEAIMFLYLPELELLKRALQKIGNITSANLDFSQLSSKYEALTAGGSPNVFSPDFHAGCLMDIGVYNVYTALELFGIPERLTSHARFLQNGADGNGTAILDYGDKTVTLTYSKTGQSRAPSQIFGDKGTVLIDSISQLSGIRIVYSDSSEEQLCSDSGRTRVMSYEAARFHDCIGGKYKKELEHAQKLSLEVSRVMEQIRAQNPGFRF